MTVNGVNPLLQPEPDYHRPYCKVCGRIGLWFATQDEAQAAVAWHIFSAHREVWLTAWTDGVRREPNVPRPTPLDPQPNPNPTDIETRS